MKNCYILLHGAWHASWCWQYITPILEQAGHEVLAPDLPGHGANQCELTHINLATYLAFLKEIVDRIDLDIILVGHSMSGIIISQLAENMPHKIAQLIYIAAFIPKNGESLLDTAKQSRTTGIAAEMRIDPLANEIVLNNSAHLMDLFYNQCSKQDAEFALQHLQKEPFQPFVDKVQMTQTRFGLIKKRYIECLNDRVLLPKDQKRMYRKVINDVINLPCDHSPFFSDPQALAKAILLPYDG